MLAPRSQAPVIDARGIVREKPDAAVRRFNDESTRVIVDVAKPLGIAIHYHIIVGKLKSCQFREAEADFSL